MDGLAHQLAGLAGQRPAKMRPQGSTDAFRMPGGMAAAPGSGPMAGGLPGAAGPAAPGAPGPQLSPPGSGAPMMSAGSDFQPRSPAPPFDPAMDLRQKLAMSMMGGRRQQTGGY